MEFCPKCNGVMLPAIIGPDEKLLETEKDIKEAKESGKAIRDVFRCLTCGYEKDPEEVDKSGYKGKTEKVETNETVIMRGDESGLRSTVREICPKCGHDRASYELLQTRSADEAPTRFFTCEKCHHKWRGYD